MRKSKERWSEAGAVKEKAERFNLGGDRGTPKLLQIYLVYQDRPRATL